MNLEMFLHYLEKTSCYNNLKLKLYLSTYSASTSCCVKTNQLLKSKSFLVVEPLRERMNICQEIFRTNDLVAIVIAIVLHFLLTQHFFSGKSLIDCN